MRSLIFTVFLLAGCASPHMSARATHELRHYAGRPDGLLSVETWTDSHGGGGWFLCSDSSLASLADYHTNMFGGGSAVFLGPGEVKVDPQTGAIMGATGTALGNVGAVLMKAAGIP